MTHRPASAGDGRSIARARVFGRPQRRGATPPGGRAVRRRGGRSEVHRVIDGRGHRAIAGCGSPAFERDCASARTRLQWRVNSEQTMPDEKSVLDKIEEKAKEIGEKVEKVLDDISADEEPLKITYPDKRDLERPTEK
jgi:hypothetical protein